MDNNEVINKLIDDINNMLFDYYCHETPFMIQQEEHLKVSSAIFAPIQHQSFNMLNLNNAVFSSINSILEGKLLSPGIYAHQPLNFAAIIELIHPDDQIFFLKFEKAAIQFLLQLPLERAKEFSFGFTIRLMNKQGEFEYFGFSFNVVVCDERGKVWLLMMNSKYCPLYQLKKDSLYRIISIEPFDLIRKSKLFSKKEFIYLTNREKEIVTKVNYGFQKKEIAEILGTKPNTIKTHFSHIIGKSGFSHIHQACLHISKTGIITLFIVFCML